MALLIGSNKSKKIDLNPAPSFWNEGCLRLFISHLSIDKFFAQSLKDKLLNYGISGFVAHSDIEPTREWLIEIELALSTCEAVLALMSAKFHESNWTDQEIGIALGYGKVIIPTRMGMDPYGFISKFQAITFKTEEKVIDEIFSVLVKNSESNVSFYDASIRKF
jgi:hypothetical protein